MTRRNKQEERAKQLRAALTALVGDPRFEQFIQVLRDHREIAIEDSCTDAVIANERNHLAAIGEVRCYKSILAIYDDLVAHKDEIPAEEIPD